MKPITLHPSSLLVGVALAGLAFFTMAQTPQPISPVLTRQTPSLLRAQDMVTIKPGSPYTVPPNKWFVLTALGDTTWDVNSGQPVGLFVNGLLEVSAGGMDFSSSFYQSGGATWAAAAAASFDSISMRDAPRGFSAAAGSIISVNGGSAWGYLSDS